MAWLVSSSPGWAVHCACGIGIQPSRRACRIGVSTVAAAALPPASRQTGCTSGAPLNASRLPYSSNTAFCRPAGTPTTVQYTCFICSEDGNSAASGPAAASW